MVLLFVVTHGDEFRSLARADLLRDPTQHHVYSFREGKTEI